MSKKLSRRDFLKLAGATSAGLALSACGVNATEVPTATFVPPTGTPSPTATPAPTSTPNFDRVQKGVKPGYRL
ncbi:MAG: twin-arginine translocation signal domain-containing protein [Anaerolineales bacterium]|nr:twin-arginine translocation signal domain-containing protein [Anaerolineales bacterium]